MANVHGLFSDKKSDDDDEPDESNNRFVGGIGDRGGGSGLAVEPNNNEGEGNNSKSSRDAIFGLAQNAAPPSGGGEEQTRRIITMYRNGFTVDDGAYRRLDDPENADFLRALASGRTPPELADGDVEVGLVDKRDQDYVEQFQSFSGTGASLGTTEVDGVVFTPSAAPPPVPAGEGMIRIAVRLLNGQRQIIKLPATATVAQLAEQITADTPFRLSAGFPPQPLCDKAATLEGAGLKGAQVSVIKAE